MTEIQPVGQRMPWRTPDPERLLRAEEYARKSRTHMWVSFAIYLHSTDALRDEHDRAISAGDSRAEMTLDVDNLCDVQMCCYICERVFAPRLLNRACAGPG